MGAFLKEMDNSSITLKRVIELAVNQNLKALLKEKFETGKIPNGADFALFIDAFVAYINGKGPDESGFINTDFRVIDPVGPDAPPSHFEFGTSEFITTFNKADYADYIAEDPSIELIPDGMLAVRTFKDADGMCFQEIDTIADGKFNASFYRLCDDANDKWFEVSMGTATENLEASIPKVGNSPYFELDEEGNLVVKIPDLGSALADGITLTVNEDGKLVSSGEPGPEGPRGPEGPEGPPGAGLEPNLNTPSLEDIEEGGAGRDAFDALPEGSLILVLSEGKIYVKQNGEPVEAFDLRGEKGEKGERGDQGVTGPAGPSGERGERGPAGNDGVNGEQGIQGVAGPQGPVGPSGSDGSRGPQGIQGPQGPQGEGIKINLTVMFIEDVEEGGASEPEFNALNEGDLILVAHPMPSQNPDNGKVYVKNNGEAVFAFSLEGKDGLQGEQGPQGPQGEPGAVRLSGIITAEDKQEALDSLSGFGGEDGDAFWVTYPEYTGLYLYNSSEFITEPGWQEGPNLMGSRGAQGAQGPQGIRGATGPLPPDIGTAQLETDAQTIKEAINEVFQSGNNVKAETVAALLSKYPDAGVTVNSSWTDIVDAIRNIPSSGVINGREIEYRWLQKDDLKFGDFVKNYTNGLNAQDADAHQISNSYYDLASSAFMLPIGKNRLVAFCSVNGASSNLGVRIIEVKNKRIIPLGTYRTVNVTQYSGYYSNAIMMNDTKGVYLCTFGSNVAIHLRTFVINGNEFETPTNGVDVINVAGAGMGAILTKLTNDRFMIHSNENGTLTRRIYSFNSTANTFSLISTSTLKSGTGVLRDKIQVVPIKEEDGKLVYAVKFIDTANLAMAYAIYSLDLSTMGVNVIHPISNVIPPTGSVMHSGKHATMHLWDYNGVKKLIFFHPNSGSNYRLTYTEIELDVVTSAPKENTLSSVQVSAINNSGGNTNNVGTYNFHNEHFISPYEMVVAFSNNTNAYSIVFNLLTKTTSDEITLRTGSNSSTHPYSAMTNDHQFVFALTNGASSSNARPYRAYAFNPFNHVRKATEGDVILGVVTSPNSYPQNVGVTTPPLQ